jgi:hypothetical protein
VLGTQGFGENDESLQDQGTSSCCPHPESCRKVCVHSRLSLVFNILILHGRRYVNIATAQIHQVAFSKFDMKIHMDDEPTDYTKLWASIMEEATGVVDDNPQPVFGECLSFIVNGHSEAEHNA